MANDILTHYKAIFCYEPINLMLIVTNEFSPKRIYNLAENQYPTPLGYDVYLAQIPVNIFFPMFLLLVVYLRNTEQKVGCK